MKMKLREINGPWPDKIWFFRWSLVLLSLGFCAALGAGDWPQWGGAASRCGVSDAKNLPVAWSVGDFDRETGKWIKKDSQNIRWVAKLGSTTYGTPIVAGGRVFCATNNGGGWLKKYPPDLDLGCLLCFRQDTGGFLWQLSREKLAAGRAQDWPEQGICSAPLVEGGRAWIVTNRGEVVCIDVKSKPASSPPNNLRPVPGVEADAKAAGREKNGEAKIAWIFDMIKELGVVPHNMTSGSATSAGDLLFVNTGNGADEKHERVPAPNAPSFIALDKNTGKLVWADNSPGENILDGQWSSPAFAVLGGVPQVIFPGGDGWVYSFRAESPKSAGKAPAKPDLLWKFDCNPKDSLWNDNAASDRCNLIATPVIYRDKVYIAVGQDPEGGEGPGRLWCIDPAKRGDVSPELVFDKQGKPVAPRRNIACDASRGETTKPNPNSAAVWRYTGADADGDGKIDFKETMHRTLGMAAIEDDLLVIADITGLVHCLDARTGKLHWTHDLMSIVWGSPCIADGKIFIGNEDGDVVVFALSQEKKVLGTNPVGSPVYTTPVAAGNTLYIATKEQLIAVGN
ncbi:MAG: PQQ-binding-like beta-propeller repeat protein [Pirellulales bacterium]|nr:PQQ-binding-like beta-propeller repeat protein [Pirellulales bacterium]